MGLNEILSRTYPSLDGYLSRVSNPVLWIFLIGTVIRLLLLPLTNVDSIDWYHTAENIISGNGLYTRTGYFYGPLFGYVVSVPIMLSTMIFDFGTFSEFSSEMIALQEYFTFKPALQTVDFLAVFKIMMVVGDALCAFLVRWFIFYLTRDQKKADLGFACTYLSPIIFIESGIHGMFDIYCGILALLSVYFAIKEKYLFCGIAWTMATLMKIFPAFLLPVLVAYILRRDKGNLNKIILNLGLAVIGGVAVFLVLYYPQMAYGTFEESWSYLFGRVSKAVELVGKHWLLALTGVVALVVLIYAVIKYVPPEKRTIRLTAKRSILIMLGLVALVFLGLVSVTGGVSGMFDNLFYTSYLLGVVVQGIALLISFYLGYKLYHSKSEDDTKLLIMVGTLAMASSFLWVPMPEYLILIIPIIVVYAMVYDRRYLNPYLLISFGAAFFIIMVEGPMALFVSVGGYLGIPPMDWVISLTEFYMSGPMIGNYSVLQVIFCAIGAAAQLIGVILLFVYRFRPYRMEVYRI